MVIAKPDIRSFQINEDHDFIIMASMLKIAIFFL